MLKNLLKKFNLKKKLYIEGLIINIINYKILTNSYKTQKPSVCLEISPVVITNRVLFNVSSLNTSFSTCIIHNT